MIHVTFLRAINVGGRAVVKMADLKSAFERAGARNVRTFIASGNVIFEAPARLPAALKERIRRELVGVFGKEPGVCYRTIEQLEALIESDPFGARSTDKTLKLYVCFADREPKPRPTLPLLDTEELVEITDIRDADMLVVSRRKPNGMYGFPNLCVEALGVVSTSRNWNTVMRVAEFARRSG